MSEALRLSVVIPSWNAATVLGPCLASLRTQQVEGGFETIVVDNASSDATQEVLRRYSSGIRVITNERNEGFSAACNQGAQAARGAVLLFLNDDTELLAGDVLERIARAVEQPGVGIAGPKLLNTDRTLQPSCAQHPTIPRALVLATGAHFLLPDRLRARWAPHRWSHGWAADTGWVKGAAVAVRAGLFRELGGFWPTLYGEEQDLALRAQRLGLRVRFEPSATILHVGDHSFGQTASRVRRAERVAHAELLFLREHYARPRAVVIRAVMLVGFAARAAAHAALGHRTQAAVYRTLARAYAGAR